MQYPWESILMCARAVRQRMGIPLELLDELHITPFIVPVGVLRTVGVSNDNRPAIGAPFSLAEFFDRLPTVGTFVLDRGEHVCRPGHVGHLWVLFQKPEQCSQA